MSVSRTRLLHWLLILGVFFPAMALTLPLLPFSDGMETFNVLTAIEVARDGEWVLPTLWGLPRLEKPPLAQWITAGGILLGGDLESAARWPGLLIACASLIAIYEWGRLMSGIRAGLVAAAIAGSTLFFMRFGRRAAYDGQLLFWIACTNLAFSYAVWKSANWRVTLAGGVALGGAMLTKGPPGLLHSVLPAGIYAAMANFTALPWLGAQPNAGKRLAKAIVIALAVASAISLIWVGAVVQEVGFEPFAQTFRRQVTQAAEREERIFSTPLAVFAILMLLLPWTAWFFGAFIVIRRDWQTIGPKMAYLMVMTLAPVIAHVFVPVMRDRYLLPVLPAAAVMMAVVVETYLARPKTNGSDRLGLGLHFACVAGMTCVYPIVDASDVAGTARAWMFALGGASLASLLIGIWMQRRHRTAIVYTTVICMLFLQVAYAIHENAEKNPLRDLAIQLREKYPDAKWFCLMEKPAPRDLAIYLGRKVKGIHEDDLPKLASPGKNQRLLLVRYEPEMPVASRKLDTFQWDGKELSLWQLNVQTPQSK